MRAGIARDADEMFALGNFVRCVCGHVKVRGYCCEHCDDEHGCEQAWDDRTDNRPHAAREARR